MGVARNILVWCALLTKRLYKKLSYVIILLLIPATVLMYGYAAQEESGILTIVLTQEDPSDLVAAETIEDMFDSSHLIRFIKTDSVQDAQALVRGGKADAAWIFPAHMQQKIQEFITQQKSPDAIVRVLVREENVAMMLANEKLGGALFQHCARAYFLHYMRQNAPVLDGYTDDEILTFYDDAMTGDQLFAFSYMDGQSSGSDNGSGSYLLSPMRGLLGVLIALSGLATAMYYIGDDAAGMFALVPLNRRPLVEMGYQLISILNVSVVSMVCLAALGLGVRIDRELLVLVLYALCCASFCQLVRLCCGGLRLLGTVLVLLVVFMFAVCPVFYDFAALRYIQLLLPPTYFVNAAYNDTYLLYMIAYTASCQMLSMVVRILFKKS